MSGLRYSNPVGVTGSRTVPDGALNYIEDVIFGLDPQHRAIIWGGCVGSDYQCAVFAEMYDMERHAVIPPNTSLVVDDWEDWSTSFEHIPDGPDGYKRRNQRIVDLSERLIAFPLYPEDHPQSRRSGTWQTIRMGRRKGIMADADIHILSEIVRPS